MVLNRISSWPIHARSWKWNESNLSNLLGMDEATQAIIIDTRNRAIVKQGFGDTPLTVKYCIDTVTNTSCGCDPVCDRFHTLLSSIPSQTSLTDESSISRQGQLTIDQSPVCTIFPFFNKVLGLN